MSMLQPTLSTASAANIPAPAVAPAAPAVSAKTWIAVIGATLGAFMAVLNIQIVNASLADIQGAIGAGIDDGGWISTSYLIAEIVVIPLSGWLAQVFSIRIYLLTNAILFLVLSRRLRAGAGPAADDRATRGAGFHRRRADPDGLHPDHHAAAACETAGGPGAVRTVRRRSAPAIGPTIGGYLTENFGWQYIFYVNLVPGAIMVGMLLVLADAKPMKLSQLAEGDWAGIITMAIGLSALQTVLEEGNNDDSFGSLFIVKLSTIAAVALAAFLIIDHTVGGRVNIGVRWFAALFGFGMSSSSRRVLRSPRCSTRRTAPGHHRLHDRWSPHCRNRLRSHWFRA